MDYDTDLASFIPFFFRGMCVNEGGQSDRFWAMDQGGESVSKQVGTEGEKCQVWWVNERIEDGGGTSGAVWFRDISLDEAELEVAGLDLSSRGIVKIWVEGCWGWNKHAEDEKR